VQASIKNCVTRPSQEGIRPNLRGNAVGIQNDLSWENIKGDIQVIAIDMNHILIIKELITLIFGFSDDYSNKFYFAPPIYFQLPSS